MTDESAWIFETADYEGTRVVLSQATWHAKAGNGELGSHPGSGIQVMLASKRESVTYWIITVPMPHAMGRALTG